MFNNISWQGYWTGLAISLAIYYFLIFLIYYRKDFKASFLTKKFIRSGDQSFILTENDHPEFQTPSKESEEGMVYACMDELNAFFEEARKRKWNKDELIYSLQLIMKKYPSIKTSGYKQSLSKVLLNQCEYVCNIHLNAEELSHVWLGS